MTTTIAHDVLVAKREELKHAIKFIDDFCVFLHTRHSNMRARQETYIEELGYLESAMERVDG